jgi:hypothetical protein
MFVYCSLCGSLLCSSAVGCPTLLLLWPNANSLLGMDAARRNDDSTSHILPPPGGGGYARTQTVSLGQGGPHTDGSMSCKFCPLHIVCM